MSYLVWFAAVAVTLILSGLTAPIFGQDAQAPASSGNVGVEVRELADQMKAKLYARRDEEKEYIDKVVKLVDQGKLPRSLVQSTFLWARYKKPRPLVYFAKALKVRADKLDLETPDFEILVSGLVPQIR